MQRQKESEWILTCQKSLRVKCECSKDLFGWRFMVRRAMCGAQLKDRTRAKDIILMSGLNATIDQLAMANSLYLHGHVLTRSCHEKGITV